MKLKWRKIEKDGKGQIALEPQEEEDMWHLYNLIQEGDLIKATTFRNVKTTGTTGTVKSEKKRVTVTLQVDSVDFDTKSASMRVSGRNREENKFIRMNAHHTVELAVHRSLTLIKDRWDSIHLERVKMATDPTQSADLAAIVLQEGLAHVCLITSYTTLIRQKVQMTVPRKRMGSDTRHKRALERFYASIYDAVVRHINFDVVKCVLVASPAFYKEELVKRIFELASKSGNRKLLENRSKFVKRQAASGHMQALRQVLADQSCSDLIKTTKAFEEVKALEDFFTMMNKNPDRAFYGYRDVLQANDAKAINVLLVTDTLFRSRDIKTRQQYVKLVEMARENGADVKIFSSMHVSGQQLDQLTGVAALLRFPVVLEDEDEPAEAPAPEASDRKGAASAGRPPTGKRKKKKKKGGQEKKLGTAAGRDGVDAVDNFFLMDF